MNDALGKYFDALGHIGWVMLAALCALAAWWGISRKRRALAAFAHAEMLSFLAPNLNWTRQYVKAALLIAAALAIVAALIGPRWGTFFEHAQERQLDVMICLDVSKSMLAEDAGMSRLDRAKDDVLRLLEQMNGGTVGLVAFAGATEVVCPLTDDYEFFRLLLMEAGIHSAPRGGTNIGEAIFTAVKAFGEPRPRDRTIILMTDGEDHGDRALDAARLAADSGITVYAVGIGDETRGGLIPVDAGGERTFLKYNEQQVWSKLDPRRLTAIARAGGGEYLPSGQVTSDQRTLEWLYATRLAPRRRQDGVEREVERRHARFHWFAAGALALLMIETLVNERSPRRRLVPSSATGSAEGAEAA